MNVSAVRAIGHRMIAAAVLFSTTSPAHCGDSYLCACAFASAHACVRDNARVPLQWRRVTDNANAVSGYAKIAFDCVRAVVKGLPHGGQRIVRLLQRPCATMRDDESALARGVRPALPLQRGAPGRRSRCGKRKEEEVRQHSTKGQDGGPVRIHEKVVTRLSPREIYKVATFRGEALDLKQPFDARALTVPSASPRLSFGAEVIRPARYAPKTVPTRRVYLPFPCVYLQIFRCKRCATGNRAFWPKR